MGATGNDEFVAPLEVLLPEKFLLGLRLIPIPFEPLPEFLHFAHSARFYTWSPTTYNNRENRRELSVWGCMGSSYDKVVQSYIDHELFQNLVETVVQAIDATRIEFFQPTWQDQHLRLRTKFSYRNISGSLLYTTTILPESPSDLSRFGNYWDFADSDDFDRISAKLFYELKLPNFNCRYEPKDGAKKKKDKQIYIKSEFRDRVDTELRKRVQEASERFRTRLWDAHKEYMESDRFKEECEFFLKKEIKETFTAVLKQYKKVHHDVLQETYQEFLVESLLVELWWTKENPSL